MTRHAGHFDEFQPHTRLKHTILDTYIVAWAMKLLMWGGAGHRLAIVDAFAGAGRDEKGSEGSPLIAVRRARQATEEAKKHVADAKIQVFALENDAGRFHKLEETLAPFSRETPDLVHALHGELSDHIDQIRAQLGQCPTFYFLDPFGVKGLDAGTYPKALSGPQNELFALFAHLGAVRLHGLVTADRADPSDDIAAILSAPSLFPEDDAERVASAEAAAARKNVALDASIPASREHLTRALGSDEWVAEMAHIPAEQRADKFIELFRRALIRAGARFVLAIPMRNVTGQRVYSLVHASKSQAGFVTMKESVSAGLKKAILSEAARQRIMADLSIDVHQLIGALQRALAGRTIPWASNDGLLALLLRATPLFQFQSRELKLALKQATVLRRVDRKEVCAFSPRSESE